MGDLLLLRPAATTVTIPATHLELVDVHDPQTGVLESVRFTLGDHEIIIEAPDLLASIDAARRLLDQVEAGLLEVRQDAAVAARHACWCGVLLEGDDVVCGAVECVRAEQLDIQGRIP